MTAIHAFSAKQMNGKPMPLKKFKGKDIKAALSD